MVGSSVAEAYQVLLRAAVVIQLIPFIYLFLALIKADGVSAGARAAGVVGLVTTAFGLGAAFLPTADVTSVALFETKMVVGVVGPTAVGWLLFKRAQRVGADLRLSIRSDFFTGGSAGCSGLPCRNQGETHREKKQPWHMTSRKRRTIARSGWIAPSRAAIF